MLISLAILGQGVPISQGSPYRSYTGSSSTDNTDQALLAAVVDSAVKALLPQLSSAIEQQVSQAVRAAVSLSGSTGSSIVPHSSTVPAVGDMPPKAALTGIPTFSNSTAPMGLGTKNTSSSSTLMAVTPSTHLAALIPTPSSNLSTAAIAVGPSSPPIPLKLAQKIWSNEYIELHDLLPARLGIHC